MGDERGAESPKSWLNRLTNLLTNEPDSRAELLAIVQSAGQRGILDADLRRCPVVVVRHLRRGDLRLRLDLEGVDLLALVLQLRARYLAAGLHQ